MFINDLRLKLLFIGTMCTFKRSEWNDEPGGAHVDEIDEEGEDEELDGHGFLPTDPLDDRYCDEQSCNTTTVSAHITLHRLFSYFLTDAQNILFQ